ncbi:hypothetical protein [Maricaulis sp. MIT060901]|uniref:hypothetical protein n=1 Tax=Maricaulis sp. MIT060901 TaxID=3096993 RepID=UPI00399C1DC4
MATEEISEQLRLARPPVIRYQRERPGELIHLDIMKLGRFCNLCHRITKGRKGFIRLNGPLSGLAPPCVDEQPVSLLQNVG